MAQVTVELRKLLETDFKLFDFEYKFDDPVFKKELENHVIEYFWDYEIGQETPDMFKRKFKARWLRCIGYYNTLYNTTLLEYNPLTNYSLNEAMEQLSNSESNAEGTSTSLHNTEVNSSDSSNETENRQSSVNGQSNEKASDYPQQSITTGDYLSGEKLGTNTETSTDNNEVEKTTTINTTTDDNGSITNTNTNTETSSSSYQKTIEGITGITYQDLIKKQRDLIIRIPDMVCQEMKPCFVLVY